MVDYALAASAAVMVAAVVVLASLLSRYSQLVREVDRSNRLAKDVWDSANSRFSVVDARIIDLMAKTDVLSSRMTGGHVTPQTASTPVQPTISQPNVGKVLDMPTAIRIQQSPPISEGTETEAKVLRFLAQGPRSSAEIKEQLGRSREHTARLMKSLFDRGLVVRNERNKPYVYEITESGKSYAAS
jgi:biotin operon repressor